MFVSEWASAEFYLGVILGKMLLSPEYLSKTYTDFMGAAQLQDAIQQAIVIHKKRYAGKLIANQLLDEILALNKEIVKLRSIRNKFAHFCWMRTSDEEVFGTNFSGAAPSDKRHNASFKTLNVSEIRKHYDDLFRAVERMQEISLQIPKVTEDAAISAFKAVANGP